MLNKKLSFVYGLNFITYQTCRLFALNLPVTSYYYVNRRMTCFRVWLISLYINYILRYVYLAYFSIGCQIYADGLSQIAIAEYNVWFMFASSVPCICPFNTAWTYKSHECSYLHFWDESLRYKGNISKLNKLTSLLIAWEFRRGKSCV